MRERPILMTPENAQKCHDGTKTQTRRIVKPQPPEDLGKILGPEMYAPVKVDKFGEEYPAEDVFGVYSYDGEWGAVFPYGQVGERIWVREAWGMSYIDIVPTGRPFLAGGTWGSPSRPRRRACAVYTAHGPMPDDSPYETARWCPSIHMPRWACRTVLEITELRVERLKDISPADALAEGVFCPEVGYAQHGERAPVLLYGFLWESIHGAGSWAQNPWVWVISFRKVGA